MTSISRRTFVGGSLGSAALIATGGQPSRAQDSSSAQEEPLAVTMVTATQQFLDTLTDAQVGQATFGFNDPERVFWHWTATSNVPRNGLRFGDMDEVQQQATLNLLSTGTSETGYEKSLNIMSLQADLGRDPTEFYLSVFGDPAGSDPWGWRFEGHHLSLHLTVADNQVTAFPFFLGAWPTQTETGLVTMDREESAARELVNALDPDRRAIAIFEPQALGTHVTQNAVSVTPLDPVGLPASQLNEAERGLFDEILATYLGTLPDEIGAGSLQDIEQTASDSLTFGWSGSLQPLERHYYRIQGPTFLLEFDNSRNGATHIHSVWRNFVQDFGGYR